MLTDLRYIAGQIRRAQRHLNDRRDAGVANALGNALNAVDRCVRVEEAREEESREPWTPEDYIRNGG